MHKPIKGKFYTVFDDETINRAIECHSEGYDSIDEAIEDSLGFTNELNNFYVIDHNKVKVWPKS